MKKIIGIGLIVLGVVLAIMGFDGFQDSSASVEFLGLDIYASDKSGQQTAVIYLVLGVISGIGGVSLMRSAE